MITYIVTWCEYEYESGEDPTDHYETFEDYSSAQARYQVVVSLDATYSANISKVLES
tara:strand:- start:16714 stop:16884 length:171 start_codon:yes stop_codon:yes gene_type:complete